MFVKLQFDNMMFRHHTLKEQMKIRELENINHLERLSWLDWVNNLSRYKYDCSFNGKPVPGTFSLNCAYWGIPCIGNDKVDTQRLCFPDISVDIDDIDSGYKTH